MKTHYIPTTDEGKALWLHNFATKLQEVSTRYMITDQERNDALQAAFYFESVVKLKNQFTAFQKSFTAFKNALRDGVNKGQPNPVLPEIPVYSGLTSDIPAFDIFGRMSSIAQRIKNHYQYTEADGKNLGLIGTEVVKTESNKLVPLISVVVSAGGHPEVVWTKNGMTALEIMVSRDGGSTWTWLAQDTIPNYTDEYPLPVQPALWQYKAIYRQGDNYAGQWSDVASVTVVQQ
ncbi:hypothetical protein D3C72_730040 [compost metagenome]